MVVPRLFPPEVVVAVKALACALPSRLGVPLSRLHVPDIAAEVVSRGIVTEISGATTDSTKSQVRVAFMAPTTPHRTCTREGIRGFDRAYTSLGYTIRCAIAGLEPVARRQIADETAGAGGRGQLGRTERIVDTYSPALRFR